MLYNVLDKIIPILHITVALEINLLPIFSKDEYLRVT